MAGFLLFSAKTPGAFPSDDFQRQTIHASSSTLHGPSVHDSLERKAGHLAAIQEYYFESKNMNS
jgi:hypothetical protein